MICTALLCLLAERGRGERTKRKTQNMVSISWYLPGKSGGRNVKNTALRKFRKNIFQKWLLKVYTYVYIYGHGHREEEKRERRSFVDDGIPPDKVPCRSRFHRWNGHRHDWATMETKIIRGRWDPSRQAALPVEVPPLEWLPT